MEVPPIEIHLEQWRIVLAILQRHVPECEVWAFGSRATRTAKRHSDLDLAIISSDPLDDSLSLALREDFAESDLPFKVDVVDWVRASDTFRDVIRRDRVVVQEGRRLAR